MPADVPAAVEMIRRFRVLWEELAAEHPEVDGFLSDLGYVNLLSGALEGGRGAAGDRAAFRRGVAFVETGAALFDRLARARPDDPNPLEYYAITQRELAWQYSQVGDPAASEQSFARGLAAYQQLADRFPDVPAYRQGLAASHYNLGVRLAKAGRTDDAVAAFRRAFQLAADLARRSLVTRIQSRLLVDIVSRLSELAPQTAAQTSELEATLTAVLENRPDDPDILAARGRVYLHLAPRRPEKAIADLTRAMEVDPNDGSAPWWLYDRSRAHAAAGKHDRALADLDRAAERWPKLWDVWVWRGNYWRERADWEATVADYSRALELNPNYWPAYHGRGLAHAALTRWAAATADLAKAVQLGPQHAGLNNDLAWLLATCPDVTARDPGRAVDLARQAVAPSPGTARSTTPSAWRCTGPATGPGRSPR